MRNSNSKPWQNLGASLVIGISVVSCGSQSTEKSEPAQKMIEKNPFEKTSDITPPAHKKVPFEITQHGETRTDNYAWMRVENWQEVLNDPSQLDADVRNVLDIENDYYKQQTDDLETVREKLFAEMRGRIKEDDAAPPMPSGPWLYWTEFREGGEYPIFKRKPREGGDTQLIFDGDEEGKGSEFFRVAQVSHSPNHKLAAHAVDRLGSESYTIRVRNIETGIDLDDVVEGADAAGAVWAADSNAFYYIDRDENQRPRRVLRHVLGTPATDDKLIYEEESDDFFLSLSKSQSGNYIFITSGSQITSEVRYIDAADQSGTAKVIAPRENGVEYYPDHHGDQFYISTNADGAVDFKIVTAPIANPGRENWKDWRAYEDGVNILDFATYKDYIVRLERRDALPRLVVSTYDGEERAIEFEEAAYSLSFSSGYEYDTDVIRFGYESPATPDETFDYNMATDERTLLKRKEIPSGHDPKKYLVERFNATASDGAEIPVTVLRLKDQPLSGELPVLLYGYGSYGITIPASFSTNILSLVDRGVVFATAHPRGGAARGRQWYLDGKLEKKMNTFTDFNQVAETLIDKGYTKKKKIVIYGGSAGGLLVGASINLRQDLYAGVIGAVPFVDVLNTISDGDLPLTPPEWEEWGNPIESAEEYAWIKAYSPYENIKNTQYPPILATGGLTDYRVTYWEMAKWVARLRDDAQGGPFLLRMNMGAGHAGSAARFESLDERAHIYAFALKALGVEDVEPVK